MKALFIIHCQDPIYGASRSIGNLIRHLDADVDLIFPTNTTRKISDEQIRKYYGGRVQNVWFLPQPIHYGCIDAYFPPIHHIKSVVKHLMYLFCKGRYRRIYQQGQYDFIHLNSVALHPMVMKDQPMIVHIRETLRKKQRMGNKRLPRHLGRAHGLVYISQEVYDSCPVPDVPGMILVNPFDQRPVGAQEPQVAYKAFGLAGNETVFSMIGNVDSRKGVGFVIQAFRKADPPNAALLIVGKDTHGEGYEAQAKAEAGGDPRIRFVGELEDTDSLYRVTDYVIRGDAVPGAGRTVFEGLFSGGGAILVGSKEENLGPLMLSSAMEDRVWFYPPRDEEKLAALFRERNGHRFEQRDYSSNMDEYINQFCAFLDKCLP